MSEAGGVQLFQGRVTHVIDPFNFWAQVGTEEDKNRFRLLEEKLFKFCESIGCIRISGRLEHIDSGCCVLVKHNRVWYRAEVARIDSERRKLDIVYVDYGDSDRVSIDQVCTACPMMVSELKPQAVKCRLAGITPLAKNWTSRGINYFKELTKGKVFQTAIVRDNKQFMYYEVSLYTSDEEGRSLAHILIDEEIGIASDIEVPEFRDDVKSVLPEAYLENFSYDTDDLNYTNSPVGFDQSDGRDSVQSINQQSFNINVYNMSDSSNNRSDNNSPHNLSNSSNRRLYNESPYEMTNIINSRYYGNNQQTINTTYTTGFYSDSDSSGVSNHKQHNSANQMSSYKPSSGLSNQNASNRYGKESRRLYMNDNASNSTQPLSGLSTPLNYSTDFESGDDNFNSKNSFQSIYSNSWATTAPMAKQDSSDQSNNFWSNFPTEDQIKTAPSSIWSYNYTATNGDHINNIWSTNDGSNIWGAVPTTMEDKPTSVEPPSPEVIIPGFNLSTIMKTKSACPDEIQEVRDVERRVTTKTEVVDNMEQIYEELEKDEPKDIIRWGMSDLNIGTPDTSQPPDVYDNIKSQIESMSPMNTSQYKLPPSNNTPTPPSTSQYSHQYTSNNPSRYQPPTQKYTPPARFHQKDNRSSKPNRSSPKLNSRQQMLDAIIHEDSFKPVVKLENSEEAEYRFSKKIEKILKTIENEEDPVIVCDKIHSIVPPENDGCEANVLSVCIETILDLAVVDKQNTQKLLIILDSYSHCDIFGACMEYVIKKLSKAYIKLPVRKTYHTDYSIVLAKLLQLSKYWPEGVCNSIQELILSTVERWIIFNKKGLQGGADIQSLSELYIDCLETVWSLVSEVLIDEYPDKYQYYIEQIEEKFLADGLRSAYRAKLFGIYKSSLVHQQINLNPPSQSKPNTDSVCYVDTPVLKSEVMTQTEKLELESRSVQTEDNADDIQVPDEWWLRDSVTTEQQDQGDESFSKDPDLQDLNQSCDAVMEQSGSNLVRISSFSEIYRLEELKRSRSNSPLATRSDTSHETNQSVEGLKSPKSGRHSIDSLQVMRNIEAPYEKDYECKEAKDAQSEHESKMAVQHSPDREHSHQDLTARVEGSAEKVLNGKHHKEDHSKSADLFTPLFEKKSSASKKSKSKYGSWADCVKKDNVEPDSGNLHSDHLKHLAIQTLKSGVLKGKNVQARRQLSSEELKVLVKPAVDGLTPESIASQSTVTEGLSQSYSSSRTLSSLIDQSPNPAMQPSSTPPKPVSELKFVPYGNKSKDRSMPQGKFLPPKRVPTNLTATKGNPSTSKPSTKLTPLKPSKIIQGRDLPEQAKLTRRQMEERAEVEAMRKFPPKTALQQTNRPDNQSNKYRTTDVSEWPSLNSDKDSKTPKKVSKSSSNNNSLHSIATEILMPENKPSRVSEANLLIQKQTVGSNSSDSSRADKPNAPKGDNSDTTNVESKSSHYDNSDEWESDFSDDDIMVTGPTDCKAASPPIAQQVSPPKQSTYQFRPTKQDYGWSPKTRTCTNCGETTHVVYDCPRKSSILF